ncbi:unnamed protein product [Arabis nemorensis]|uniref:Geranylgeranyl pyrophosphate synthase n=1 Tax=Arabis nemorensis TaxID=586526 RepID=A0A565BSH4_9BRAS|nr:unnamed protein product [Arabis nemorensis]
MDLNSEGLDPKDVGLEHIEFIHLHKTGSLLEASAIIGVIVGGGLEEEIEKSSEELGKTASKDQIAGKLTYPKVLGLEKSKEFVKRLKNDAKEHLKGFDSEKVKSLIALANFIANRNN